MLRVFEGWMIINQYGNHRAVAIFGPPSHPKLSFGEALGSLWGLLGYLGQA